MARLQCMILKLVFEQTGTNPVPCKTSKEDGISIGWKREAKAHPSTSSRRVSRTGLKVHPEGSGGSEGGGDGGSGSDKDEAASDASQSVQ
jgi:hypothetical protein